LGAEVTGKWTLEDGRLDPDGRLNEFNSIAGILVTLLNTPRKPPEVEAGVGVTDGEMLVDDRLPADRG
jgi:hypothetical protein